MVHLVAQRQVTISTHEELAVVADGESLRCRSLQIRSAAAALAVMVPPAAATLEPVEPPA